MKFIKSATKQSEYYQTHLPIFCFLGRSNVGKSSLINALANEKIARTSNTPGRTQLINYFEADKFVLVDLPGYGFAKISKMQMEQIAKMNLSFLKDCKNLKAVFQVCDANVITALDQDMAKLFKSLKCKHYVIFNKADKIPFNQYQSKLTVMCDYLQIKEEDVVLTSAKQKKNINSIFQIFFKNI